MAKKLYELKVDVSGIGQAIEEGKQKGWRLVNSIPQGKNQFLLQFEPDENIITTPQSAPTVFPETKSRRGCGWLLAFPSTALLLVCVICSVCGVGGALLSISPTNVPGSTSGGETRYINSATGGNVFVRAGAGTNFENIGRLSHGSAIEILGEQNGWYEINFNGVTGWVSSSLTTASRPITSSGSSVQQPANANEQPAAIHQPPAPQQEQPQVAPQQEPEQPSLTCGTCGSMSSCDQAYACLQSGHGRLDADNDGVPCESICPGG